MAATDNPGTVMSSLSGAKKRPNILLIVVGILVFLLVVAVGGFLGYTRLPGVVAKHAGNDTVAQQNVKKRLETKDIIVLDQFTVNLADKDVERYLVADFRLGMAEKLKEPLDKNSAEVSGIRDSIIRLLSSKTAEQIQTPEGKDALCEEIRLIVNERFVKNRVAEVLINSFLIQY